MSKYLNDTGVVYLVSKIKTLLAGKVDKVDGKGLSTNDFTTTLKDKLDGIEAGANKYVLPSASATERGGIIVGANLSIGPDGKLNATAGVVDPVTETTNGLMTSVDKKKLDGFGEASSYALKTDISNIYKYKGSVAKKTDLPASGNTAGDVYDVQEDGMNYAWTGTEWDALGGSFSITAMTNDEIDAAFN